MKTPNGLKLFSPAMLLSVPADPLIGFLLTHPGGAAPQPVFLAAAAVLCFHLAGVITARFVECLHFREPAPLSPALGCAAAVALLAGGEALCLPLDSPARWAGLTLLLVVLLHALCLQQIPYLGPLSLGASRGIGVLLGASIVAADRPAAPALAVAAILLALYAGAVSLVGRRRAPERGVGEERWAPAVVIALGFALLARIQPLASVAEWVGFLGAFAFAGTLAIVVGDLLGTDAQPASLVHDTVSILRGSILLVQAGLVMVSGAGFPGLLFGLALLALWPLHRALCRRPARVSACR
jgi:hypothetical protein